MYPKGAASFSVYTLLKTTLKLKSLKKKGTGSFPVPFFLRNFLFLRRFGRPKTCRGMLWRGALPSKIREDFRPAEDARAGAGRRRSLRVRPFVKASTGPAREKNRAGE
mgnify:CR=1 FL=1